MPRYFYWTGVGDSGKQAGLIIKDADQILSLATALVDDTVLKVDLAALTKYFIRGSVFYDTVALADFKFQLSGPVGVLVSRIQRQIIVPGTTTFAGINVETALPTGELVVTGNGANGGYIHFDGIIHNGAVAGQFIFKWAQNTSNVGLTIVRAGSWLEWGII